MDGMKEMMSEIKTAQNKSKLTVLRLVILFLSLMKNKMSFGTDFFPVLAAVESPLPIALWLVVSLLSAPPTMPIILSLLSAPPTQLVASSELLLSLSFPTSSLLEWS